MAVILLSFLFNKISTQLHYFIKTVLLKLNVEQFHSGMNSQLVYRYRPSHASHNILIVDEKKYLFCIFVLRETSWDTYLAVRFIKSFALYGFADLAIRLFLDSLDPLEEFFSITATRFSSSAFSNSRHRPINMAKPTFSRIRRIFVSVSQMRELPSSSSNPFHSTMQ
jgi:hypothetical protein